MTNLNDILNSEDLILVDGSIRAEGIGISSFVWEMYDSRRYRHLKNEILEEGLMQIEYFLDILNKPNTFTINAVTEEIRDLEKILSQKIKYLSSINIATHKKNKREKRKRQEKPKQRLLMEMQEKAFSLYKLSKRKELSINCRKYDSLLEMVKLIENNIKLKKDLGYLNGEHETDRSGNSDTDEKLVSALYWLSLFSDKSPCLLANDRDFNNLLGVVTRLIGSASFLPYNEQFRQGIAQNSFKLYLKNLSQKGEEYQLRVISSKIRYCPEFMIYNTTKEKSTEIKDKMFRLWQDFAENQNTESKKIESVGNGVV